MSKKGKKKIKKGKAVLETFGLQPCHQTEEIKLVDVRAEVDVLAVSGLWAMVVLCGECRPFVCDVSELEQEDNP